jgi:hypothetical protein
MPRHMRREFAGAIYHVMNRGDRVAARLRKETTMSLKWIAQHLEMGSWTHVSNLLGARRKPESLKSGNRHL